MTLEVVDDVHQRPTLAAGEQIIAAPTLIKKLPLPLRRFIGDMSQTERILLGLDLRTAGETGATARPNRGPGNLPSLIGSCHVSRPFPNPKRSFSRRTPHCARGSKMRKRLCGPFVLAKSMRSSWLARPARRCSFSKAWTPSRIGCAARSWPRSAEAVVAIDRQPPRDLPQRRRRSYSMAKFLHPERRSAVPSRKSTSIAGCAPKMKRPP